MSGLTVSLFWLLLFVGGGIYLAYQRTNLLNATITVGVALAAYIIWGNGSLLWNIVLLIFFAAMVIPNLV